MTATTNGKRNSLNCVTLPPLSSSCLYCTKPWLNLENKNTSWDVKFYGSAGPLGFLSDAPSHGSLGELELPLPPPYDAVAAPTL